jgi:hypothetical protein
MVYEAFDFSASGFIQLLIRKLHPPRACSQRDVSATTTDDAALTDLGSARAFVCCFGALADIPLLCMLKLGRLPLSLAATLAALPSISEIPFPRSPRNFLIQFP